MGLEKTMSKSSIFSYIATNSETGVVRGEIRAVGEEGAIIQLERMGLEPVSVSQKKNHC